MRVGINAPRALPPGACVIETTLDELIAEPEQIDPASTEDRWVKVASGKIFRQHWEENGVQAMTEDLLRVGIRCEVTGTKIPRTRAPEIHMKMPKDVRKRLLVKEDDFAEHL